jgi:hypothetical protein
MGEAELHTLAGNPEQALQVLVQAESLTESNKDTRLTYFFKRGHRHWDLGHAQQAIADWQYVMAHTTYRAQINAAPSMMDGMVTALSRKPTQFNIYFTARALAGNTIPQSVMREQILALIRANNLWEHFEDTLEPNEKPKQTTDQLQVRQLDQ